MPERCDQRGSAASRSEASTIQRCPPASRLAVAENTGSGGLLAVSASLCGARGKRRSDPAQLSACRRTYPAAARGPAGF